MNERRAAASRHTLLGRLSLTSKMVLLSLLVGGGAWLGVDAIQRQELRSVLREELAAELVREAQLDRQQFNRFIARFSGSVKVITSQQRFLGYVQSPDWLARRAGEPLREHHEGPPPWMPTSSVLRNFYSARYALLLNAEGDLRELYDIRAHRAGESTLPRELRYTTALLRTLSHNQTYLTTFDGVPYILSAQQVDQGGRPIATLLLASALDDETLQGLRGPHDNPNVIALIHLESGRIVASSNPRLLQTGRRIDEYREDFLLQGKGGASLVRSAFLDYGSVDLPLSFVSLVPVTSMERLANRILAHDPGLRFILGGALILTFLLLLTWSTRRMRRLSLELERFAVEALGVNLVAGGHDGDELEMLRTRFTQLADAVVEGRERQRLQAEEQLLLARELMESRRRSDELGLLRSLMDALGVGIVLDDGEPRPYNPQMGRYAEECSGLAQFCIQTPGEERQLQLTDRAGRERHFSIRGHAALGPRGALVVDLSAERIARRKTREAEERLRAILDNSQAVIYLKDLEGRFLHINRRFEELFGVADGEILGRTDHDLFPPEAAAAFQRNDRETLRRGSVYTVEEVAPHPDGDHVYLSVKFVIRDVAGEPQAVGGISTDITDRKRTEGELERYRHHLEALVGERTRALQEAHAELLRSDRLATLGRLTETVSHELRNPLGTMRQSCHVLRRKCDLSDDHINDAVTRIDRNISRCDHIIDELFDFTRIRDLELSPIRIDALVSDLLAEWELPAGLLVERDLGVGQRLVRADRSRLCRALGSLLENALQALHSPDREWLIEGACLVVTTRLREERIEIEVADNGDGMEEAVVARIFEPLFSTRGFGVGLGLPAARHIMEQHGGGVEVDTGFGRGTRVTLWLPVGRPLERDAADRSCRREHDEGI